MKSSYVRIRSELLSEISPKLKERLGEQVFQEMGEPKNFKIGDIDEILANMDTAFFFLFCPYCGSSGFLKMKGFAEKMKKLQSLPIACFSCGETSPGYKMEQSLDRSGILHNLSKLPGHLEQDVMNEDAGRCLMEQCIITIATGIEVFLRDVYSALLNLRFTREGESLFHRFYRECRNDFINIGKAQRRFADDLSLDLMTILGQHAIENLNTLMLKRNVIVHNAGIVDKTFRDQSGIECDLKDPVPISTTENEHYLRIAEHVGNILASMFYKELRTNALDRMESFFGRDAL